jgi:hypothetical protein
MDSIYLAMAYAVASLATWPPAGSQFGAVLGTGRFAANSRRVQFDTDDTHDLTPEEVINLFYKADRGISLIYLIMPITRRVIANLINMEIRTVVLHWNYQTVLKAYCSHLSDLTCGVAALTANGFNVRLVDGSISAPRITIADGVWDPHLLTWQGSKHA